MNETKVLKERGNTAYKEKNYEEAIELFKQAATVEEASPAKDPKLIAILHSNVAQAYLELKK
jgi:tetratricopeptide (TPR) repeat protein